MATIACELKWLKVILSNLGVIHTKSILLHYKHQVASHMAKNPVFHEQIKHIEVDCLFIQHEILNGNIIPYHVTTHVQLADIFTKALGKR